MEIPFDIIESCDETNQWVVLIHGFGGSRRMFKKQIDELRIKFNILLLDLPGHGDSHLGVSSSRDISMHDVATDVIDLMHRLNIHKASFIGISLGTLIIANIVITDPSIVDKVILGGAIFGVNGVIRLFANVMEYIKYLLPYTLVVSIFAYMMMPMSNHKRSRFFMIKESRRLGRAEFLKWFSLVINNLDYISTKILEIKNTNSIVIMGDQDIIFIKKVREISSKYKIKLKTISKCGHVCNIDKAKEFNRIAIEFLNGGLNNEG